MAGSSSLDKAVSGGAKGACSAPVSHMSVPPETQEESNLPCNQPTNYASLLAVAVAAALLLSSVPTLALFSSSWPAMVAWASPLSAEIGAAGE